MTISAFCDISSLDNSKNDLCFAHELAPCISCNFVPSLIFCENTGKWFIIFVFSGDLVLSIKRGGKGSCSLCSGVLGSKKPLSGFDNLSGIPFNVPSTTGSCASFASLKNPNTCVPGTIPVGDRPMPDIEAEVIGLITSAQGKSSVGMPEPGVLSSVCQPIHLTFTRPRYNGS